MKENLCLVLSNRVEELYEHLKDGFLSTEDPFQKRLLVVPDTLLKSYIHRRLATEEAKISLGLEILLPKQAVVRLTGKCYATAVDLLALASQYVKSEKMCKRLAQLLMLRGWYGLQTKELPDLEEAAKEILEVHQDIFPVLTNPLSTTFEVALFGFSSICDSFHRFFTGLQGKVSYFILSPCMMYWSDICSDKEVAKLHRRFRSSLENQESYRRLLQDRSTLLANCGKVGRNFAAIVEESIPEVKEAYIGISKGFRPEALSKGASEISNPTLLQLLQNNLLLLGEETANACDTSVQLHSASTVFREVQILHQQIACSGCQQIHVYAPDIERYRPSIERLFKKGQFQILGKQNAYPNFSLFLSMLQLSTSRWSADLLFEIFTTKEVAQRLGYEPEELGAFTFSDFCWGYDEVHREKSLKREGLSYQITGQESGTFVSFVEQLVGLWTQGELETSCGRALGIFVEAVEKLFQTIEGWRTSENSVAVWGNQFEELFLSYFPSCEAHLFAALKKSKLDAKLSYEAAIMLLLLPEHELTLHAPIIFSSFGTMHACPAEMVCLIGMNEGEFPRQNDELLEALAVMWSGCEVPTLQEIDKYLFIEAILAARKLLYISYQNYSYDERTTLWPSSPVRDCLRVLQEYCPVEVKTHSLDDEVQASTVEKVAIHFADGSVKPSERVLCSFLDRVAYSPLAPYFQETRGLYLHEPKSVRLDDVFSVLEPALMRQMRKEAFSLPHQKAVKLFEKKTSTLPMSMRKASVQLLEEKYGHWTEQAAELTIDPQQMFKIELVDHCKKAEEIAPNVWRVPAISLGGDTLLTGIIEGVHPEGIVFFEKKTKELIAKAWPKILIVQALEKLVEIPLKADCLFLQETKRERQEIADPLESLRRYAAYADACRRAPSCIYPEWISMIEREDSLPQKIETPFDPYLRFFLDHASREFLEKQWGVWKKQMQELFQ